MSHSHHEIADEQYEFKSKTRSKLFILLGAGLILFILGVFLAKSGSGHHEGAEPSKEEHASAQVDKNLTASIQHGDVEKAEGGEAHAEHAETPSWIKRIYASLWMNNVFFAGLGIIGLFFIAIQYAAQAGWSAGVKRIPLAMGHWIPFAGILMLVLFFVVKHDVFHWTHAGLYDVNGPEYDEILDGKKAFFFGPGMEGGGFPIFYVLRMIVFFGLWYMFFIWIKKEMLAEDLDGSLEHWYSSRKLSTIFLIIFGYSSSVAAWDWVMSIDPHWFSTMMGWYVFASWWVCGLAMITFIVVSLKDIGYLKVVNQNHIHDLGKFVFAFSVFWTYIWFAQFMLIFYANIPEETVYFVQRRTVAPYSWIFFANLFLNFVLPFLLLMMRDSKRQIAMLKVVCPIVILGHWLDYYNMVTPGVMHAEGGIGFLEIGLAMMFLAGFLLVTLSSLAKFPLVAKHDPMMQESLGHHI